MKPKQFFFIILGVMGAIVLGAGGGYYYAYTRLQDSSAELANKLAEQEAAQEKIDSLERLSRQYEKDIEPILPVIDQALPRDKKQTEVLAQLQTIASSVGLQIRSVSMPSPLGVPTSTSQTVKAGPSVLALPINFQLSGTYAQLQAFTAKVEALNRFTNVTNLAISRPDKTKPVTYTISLNAYIKP